MTDEMNSAGKVPPAGPYKLVVFDWDGTILDTTAAIAISIQYAAEKMGLPVPSATKARSVIGLGWRDAMKIIAVRKKNSRSSAPTTLSAIVRRKGKFTSSPA